MSEYTSDFILSFIPLYNNNINEINDFIKKYKLIQKENSKKPIYCQTDKYNSFNINKFHKTWCKNLVSTNEEKIKQIVINNFNKLSNENFDKIIDKLILELNKIKYSDILYILTEQIFKKIIFDKSFYNIYCKLCIKLFSISSWQSGLFKIYTKNNKFFWIENRLSITKNNKKSKLFNSKKNAIINANNILCFKTIFIEYMFNEFKNIDNHTNKLSTLKDEDDKYTLKRKIFSNGEFLAHLYNFKHIKDNIIITYFNKLLSSKNIIQFELFCSMWIIINDIPNKTYFTNIINNLIKQKLPMRIKFMLMDLIDQ